MIETRSSLIEGIRDPSDNVRWREFVGIYKPLIRGLARQRGVDASYLEDVAQEVLVRIMKAAPSFQLNRQRGHFSSWLWTVVHHTAADHFRELQRLQREKAECKKKIEELEKAAADTPDQAWRETERRHVFHCALERVRGGSQPNTWACFEEHLLKGRPADEVAGQLGLSRTAVYANASRVLDRVRQQCAEYMEELGHD